MSLGRNSSLSKHYFCLVFMLISRSLWSLFSVLPQGPCFLSHTYLGPRKSNFPGNRNYPWTTAEKTKAYALECDVWGDSMVAWVAFSESWVAAAGGGAGTWVTFVTTTTSVVEQSK